MKKTAKITALCNQKGGVGKTVTAVNLGIGLAREGMMSGMIPRASVCPARMIFPREDMIRPH